MSYVNEPDEDTFRTIRTGASPHVQLRIEGTQHPRVIFEEMRMREQLGERKSVPEYVGWVDARKLRRWLERRTTRKKVG